MRRIGFHIDEELDAAVTAEAARRGMSKAAFIRACIRGEAQVPHPPGDDASPDPEKQAIDRAIAVGVLDPKALTSAWTAAELARFSREATAEPGARPLSDALAELRKDER